MLYYRRKVPEYVSSVLEVKIDVLPTPGRDSNPAIRSMSSHLVDELFKNGVNVVLGWDPECGSSLDVESNCSYGLQRSPFCYAHINVNGGGNSSLV